MRTWFELRDGAGVCMDEAQCDAGGIMSVSLASGYTTVLSGGGPADANVALRDRVDKGEFVGPRIIPSGQINLRQTPAEARAAVQALAAKGVKHTGEIGIDPRARATAGRDRSAEGHCR
jgi:hypothetical protein